VPARAGLCAGPVLGGSEVDFLLSDSVTDTVLSTTQTPPAPRRRGEGTLPCVARALPDDSVSTAALPEAAAGCRARDVKNAETSWLELVLTQGLNRQVKRTTLHAARRAPDASARPNGRRQPLHRGAGATAW
jgi:hypothetical protein